MVAVDAQRDNHCGDWNLVSYFPLILLISRFHHLLQSSKYHQGSRFDDGGKKTTSSHAEKTRGRDDLFS